MTGEARGNRKDRDANQDEGTQRHEHAAADKQTQNQIAARNRLIFIRPPRDVRPVR